MTSMTSQRKTALATGILFIITFAVSIPALLLYQPVLDSADFILGAGSTTGVTVAAVLELILIVANIGTAVVLYPLLKRQSSTGALGFVTARIMESAFIAVGIISLLAVVTLRQDSAGDSAAALVPIGQSLVAIHNWTFVLGPGFVVGIGNGILLGYMMYRSGLVPRAMAILGLVGGPAICLSGAAIVLGLADRGGLAQALATVPEFIWELSLGIYLTVKGFRTASPVLETPLHDAAQGALVPAAA